MTQSELAINITSALRWIKVTARVIFERLGPRWSMLVAACGLFVAVFERAIDRRGLHAADAALGAWDSALRWSLGLSVVVAGLGWFLGPALYARSSLGVMWRQPLGRWRWGLVVFCTYLVAVSPLYVFSMWISAQPARVLWWAVWLGPWWLAWGQRRLRRQALLGVAPLGLMGCLWASHDGGPWWWLVAWVLGALSLAGCGELYMRWRGEAAASRLWRARGWRGVVGAMAQLDVLTLWRLHRAFFGLSALAALLIGLFSWAVARHGVDSMMPCWALSATFSPVIGYATRQLMAARGAMFWAGRWPATAYQRLIALCAATTWPLALWLGLGIVVSPGSGLTSLPVSVGLATSLALGHIAASLGSRWRVNSPIYMLFGTLALCLCAMSPWWVAAGVYLCASSALGYVSWRLLRLWR